MSNLSSGRPCRLKSSRILKKQRSQSPTLSSSKSSKSLWARSYKNEPIPTQIRRRLIDKKYQFDDIDDESSSQNEEIMAVLEQQQQEQIQEKARLPKFKVMSDCDEFSDTKRYRMNSDKKGKYSPQRCHSVASVKLYQVPEEKKEDDDHKKKTLTKIEQFRDNNQFGLRHNRISSCDQSEVRSRAQSMQLPVTEKLIGSFPEQIIENEAEETKSLEMHHEKSTLTIQIQKLIVDEIDKKEKKKKEKEQISQKQIIAIEEQKAEEEFDTGKLSELLGKFKEEVNQLAEIHDQDSPGVKKQGNEHGRVESLENIKE